MKSLPANVRRPHPSEVVPANRYHPSRRRAAAGVVVSAGVDAAGSGPLDAPVTATVTEWPTAAR